MTPPQIRQFISNRPRTVQGDLERWIQQAVATLREVADLLEKKKKGKP